MTYEADLWACIRTRSDTKCHGYRYVEHGELPGPCTHVTLTGHASTTREEACGHRMFFVGTFELIAEEGNAA